MRYEKLLSQCTIFSAMYSSVRSFYHRARPTIDNHKIIVNYNYSKKDLDYFEEDPPVTGGIEVYDLKSDPGEKNNISREKEDLINRVRPLIIEIKKTIKSNFLNKDKNKIKIGEELKKQLETLGYL